jgi:N-acetylmuramoyl-L-alanine amidase
MTHPASCRSRARTAGRSAPYAFKETALSDLNTAKNLPLPDSFFAALTLCLEAGGEGTGGMEAVAWVIRNRIAAGNYGGNTATAVCLAPYQFSCWNSEPTIRTPMSRLLDRLSPAEIGHAAAIWEQVRHATADVRDPTHGATFYRTAAMGGKPKGTEFLVQIGHHKFFRPVAEA